MYKYLKVTLFVLLASVEIKAQVKPNLFTLTSPYERYTHNVLTLRLAGSMPMGSFASQYIDKAYIGNYSISMDWMFKDAPVSAGVEIGNDFFKQRIPRDVYSNGGQDISAIQTRTINQYPIQGVLSYHVGPVNSVVRPYVSAALGGAYVDYVNYWGSLSDQKQKFGFSYGLAAGSRFLFKKEGGFGADVRVKYNNAPFKYDYVQKGVSNINVSVGLFYRWW
jgi:hypothetical protein